MMCVNIQHTSFKKILKMRKNILKSLLLVVLLFFSINLLRAQQDPMYTQYMYNTISVNPAYAGSRGALSIVGLAREQWVGIPGRPRTQTLTLHSPIHTDNSSLSFSGGTDMGLGLSVINDDLGNYHQTMIFADYSYSIQTTDYARLAFGLKVGVNIFKANLIDLQYQTGGDPAIYNIDNKVLPNIGLGLYYYSDQGYIGLSVPKLLENDLLSDVSTLNGEELRHYFLIAGYVFKINYNLKFKPSFFVKAVAGAPLSIDLTGNLFIKDKLGIGLAYRNGDAITGLLQYYFTPQFRIGYAYDYTITDLHNVNSGTHELMLGYDFNFNEYTNTRIHSPRFF
jgi:type IX secretion system PorP/SprF family membrane protein